MGLGFENMDKKTLNSYTKKSEKKVEMKKLLVSAFWHSSLVNNRKHTLLLVCLSLATTR